MISGQYENIKKVLKKLEEIREIIENDERSSFEVLMLCRAKEKAEFKARIDESTKYLNSFEKYLRSELAKEE